MTALSKLKLTTAQKPQQVTVQQQRRNKLIMRLAQQIQLARAQQAGESYMTSKLRRIKDADTGTTQMITVNTAVRAWWFTADNGKLAVSVRYGARVIELAKGKSAVELASPQELVPVLETLKAAVQAGELDQQIAAVSTRVKANFKQ